MATTKARVRNVEITDVAAVEAEINTIVEAEEANGFVLDDCKMEIAQDPNGGIKRLAILTFQHEDFAPGGTGSGGAPLKKLELAITEAELTDAAVSQAIAFANPPANMIVIAAEIEVRAIGAGGGVTALSAEIGDAGDPDEYCTSQGLLATGHKFAAGSKLASGPSLEAAYAPQVLVTADVNVDTLTDLDMIARLFYIDLPDTP